MSSRLAGRPDGSGRSPGIDEMRARPSGASSVRILSCPMFPLIWPLRFVSQAAFLTYSAFETQDMPSMKSQR